MKSPFALSALSMFFVASAFAAPAPYCQNAKAIQALSPILAAEKLDLPR